MPLMGNMTDQQCIMLVITGFAMGGFTALYDYMKDFIDSKRSK